MERVTAPDGAQIVVHSRGAGPGVVLVHGGGVTIAEYRRLAAALADRFTVHLYNRRARADAPARREPYSVDQEIEDLGAVVAHTGARNVIGHSYGAFVALQAGLRLSLDRIISYDAPLRLAGHGMPPDFLDPTEEALRAGDLARAMAIVGAGVNPQSAATRLPIGVQTAICRLFLRTPIGRQMGELLPMTLVESRQIVAHDGPAEQYAGIAAEVLLACGANAAAYYVEVNELLANSIPRARTLVIPRSRHDAIAIARPRLVEPLAAFLDAPVAPSTRT